jgi:hypothetical protein
MGLGYCSLGNIVDFVDFLQSIMRRWLHGTTRPQSRDSSYALEPGKFAPFIADSRASTTDIASHIGHFLFTMRLLPLLKATAMEKDSDVRVVSVSPLLSRKYPF